MMYAGLSWRISHPADIRSPALIGIPAGWVCYSLSRSKDNCHPTFFIYCYIFLFPYLSLHHPLHSGYFRSIDSYLAMNDSPDGKTIQYFRKTIQRHLNASIDDGPLQSTREVGNMMMVINQPSGDICISWAK